MSEEGFAIANAAIAAIGYGRLSPAEKIALRRAVEDRLAGIAMPKPGDVFESDSFRHDAPTVLLGCLALENGGVVRVPLRLSTQIVGIMIRDVQDVAAEGGRVAIVTATDTETISSPLLNGEPVATVKGRP